jgi:hypothetical protein
VRKPAVRLRVEVNPGPETWLVSWEIFSRSAPRAKGSTSVESLMKAVEQEILRALKEAACRQ